jgi:hypothetical protein
VSLQEQPQAASLPGARRSLTESAAHGTALEEFERSDGRPAFVLTFTEVKLLGIAGVRCHFSWTTLKCFNFVVCKVGFFLDGEG